MSALTLFEEALLRYEESAMTLALHPYSQKARDHRDRKKKAVLDYVTALEDERRSIRNPDREAAAAEIIAHHDETLALARAEGRIE